MEIQNLLASVLKNSNRVVSSDLLSRLKVGDVLKAKILSIVGDSIMLEINGKFTLEAKDTSSKHYNLGDIVEFTVTDMSRDIPLIKSNISKLALLESKISEMGIKLDDENKELVKLLFKNEIPITKENLATILSTKNYYGKLLELVKENNLPVSSETINLEIKDALKSLIQNNGSTPSDKAIIQEHGAILAEEQKAAPDNKLPFVSEFLNGENKPTLEKLVFMLKNNLDFNIKDILLVDNIVSGNKTVTNQLEELIKLLDQGELDKENMVLKNNVGLDLKDTVLPKNTIASNNIISDNKIIDDKLGEIIKNLDGEKLDRDDPIKDGVNLEKRRESGKFKAKLFEILQKLDTSSIKENDKMKSAMKELFQILDEIRSNTTNNKNNILINSQIDEIKSSFEFISKLNENMAFIQIPFNINNSQRNLDIYIKKDSKGSKKINPQNARIFISLNTNNLDLVQVLIELNKKDVNLNFKVADQKIERVIKDNETILENKLKEYDFNNVIFRYSVNIEKADLTTVDFIEKKSKINTLDMRV